MERIIVDCTVQNVGINSDAGLGRNGRENDGLFDVRNFAESVKHSVQLKSFRLQTYN